VEEEARVRGGCGLRASDPRLREFSAEDQARLRFRYLFTVRRLENVWVQVNEGVVDQGAFERFQPRVGYVGARSFVDFWSAGKSAFSDNRDGRSDLAMDTVRRLDLIHILQLTQPDRAEGE
jgi:hypothetical protein